MGLNRHIKLNINNIELNRVEDEDIIIFKRKSVNKEGE